MRIFARCLGEGPRTHWFAAIRTVRIVLPRACVSDDESSSACLRARVVALTHMCTCTRTCTLTRTVCLHAGTLDVQLLPGGLIQVGLGNKAVHLQVAAQGS